MKARLPKWPRPFEVARDDIEAGKVNMSLMDAEAKRQAFEAMQQEEPEMAEFVSSMRKRFGPLQLLLDEATAKRLGAKDK